MATKKISNSDLNSNGLINNLSDVFNYENSKRENENIEFLEDGHNRREAAFRSGIDMIPVLMVLKKRRSQL